MKYFKWVALIVVVVVGLVLVNRWTDRPEEWQRRLDSVVAVEREKARVSDSAYQHQHRSDSLRLAAADSAVRADSAEHAQIMAVRDTATRLVVGARAQTRKAQALLDSAATLVDTARAQAEVIVSQHNEIGRLEGVILVDSSALHAAAKEVASLRVKLGISQETVVRETTRANDAAAARDRLIKAASDRPTPLTLLGLKLEVKPYLGYGINYNPATLTMGHGIQVGISMLRG